jgi:hypothetical protein
MFATNTSVQAGGDRVASDSTHMFTKGPEGEGRRANDPVYGCLYVGSTNTKTPLTGLITRTRAKTRRLALKTRQTLPSPFSFTRLRSTWLCN